VLFAVVLAGSRDLLDRIAHDDALDAVGGNAAAGAGAGYALTTKVGDLKVAADTMWVLLTAFLVFFMNLGFASVESGFCRAKNTVAILAKNFIVFAGSSIAFLVLGFGIMFGDGTALFGTQGLWFVSGADTSPATGDAYCLWGDGPPPGMLSLGGRPASDKGMFRQQALCPAYAPVNSPFILPMLMLRRSGSTTCISRSSLRIKCYLAEACAIRRSRSATSSLMLSSAGRISNGPPSRTRVLRHELDRVIQIVGFQDQDAAELLLGFGVGAVGHRDFAILPTQRDGRRGILQRFAAREVPALAEHVVVREALLHHRVALSVSQRFPLAGLNVS
jgi:hypothetical protein